MLHSPTTESKERSPATRSAPTFEPQQGLHPHTGMSTLRASGPGAGQFRPHLASLQSTIGNQAVLRMVSRSAPMLQAKLTVNQPRDQYEREADRVAEHVMSMTAAPVVQRTCTSSMDKYKVQRKCAACEEEEETELHRKETNFGPEFAPASVHDVLNSPGQPLDPASRAFFETRFGGDLSGVRIHDTAQAASSADAVGALGYTVGQHIAFARGQYQPGTDSGRRLLAHELAHTFQQRGAPLDSRPLSVSSATGPDEQAADRMAAEALAAPGRGTGPAQQQTQSGTGSSATPAVARSVTRALLQREVKVTCSVDPIKIAQALGGDKSAALDILSCCESGLSPLPSGCTKDLINALRKLLGKKPAETSKCPPGSQPAHSKEYQGQCCREGAVAESEHDCCPADRMNMLGTCCPVGQVAQGMACVSPPSGPGPRQ
jgi:hypothetical protein